MQYFSRIKLFALVVIFFVLQACVTRGENFPTNVSWIKTNQTTQAEVAKYYGEPSQMGNAGGVVTWTYGYYKFALFGDFKNRELKFWWNQDKSVKYFTFNSSFPEDKFKITQSGNQNKTDAPQSGAPFNSVP